MAGFGRRWTLEELELLQRRAAKEVRLSRIADELERPVTEVLIRAAKQGLTLKEWKSNDE
jgi:hypothetical protein